jgi:hypothetical protein
MRGRRLVALLQLWGGGAQQTRQKTYVSSVMDEERTRRITDHFKYHRSLKEYRAEVHKLLSSWRAEHVAAQQSERAAQRRRAAETEAVREHAQRLAEKHREALAEELRRAELEHQMVRGLAAKSSGCETDSSSLQGCTPCTGLDALA